MLTKREWILALEWAFVFLVASAMFIYGGAKPLQFGEINELAQSKMVQDLEAMQLMWTFYGYSEVYPFILGVFEIIGGLLLIFRSTRIIGSFFITGILTNIIIQDIIYDVHEGALYAAIIYQILILGILIINKDRVIKGFKSMLLPQVRGLILKRKWVIIGVGILGSMVLKYFEWLITQ